jgi:hypothetical protein
MVGSTGVPEFVGLALEYIFAGPMKNQVVIVPAVDERPALEIAPRKLPFALGGRMRLSTHIVL